MKFAFEPSFVCIYSVKAELATPMPNFIYLLCIWTPFFLSGILSNT